MRKCIHGLPDGSCKTCSRAAQARPRTNLTEVLLFLGDLKVRATYGAVAECIGVIPQSMGERLGDRTPEASWVVSTDDGRPTGYSDSEMHPDLFRSSKVINTCRELLEQILEWRRKSRTAQ